MCVCVCVKTVFRERERGEGGVEGMQQEPSPALTPGLPQQRQEGLGGGDGTEQIDVHQFSIGVHRYPLDGAVGGELCVVHQPPEHFCKRKRALLTAAVLKNVAALDGYKFTSDPWYERLLYRKFSK